MVRKLIVVLLLIVGVGTAQRSDTVWQQLTNTSGTGGTFSSLNVNNIGQTGHTAFISLTGGSCSAGHIQGGFQFSWDGSNYYPFGYQGSSVTSTDVIAVVSATGAFPFVRTSFTYAIGCVASVYYTGVVANPFTNTVGSIPVNTNSNIVANGNTPNPVIGGSLMGTSSTSTDGMIGVNIEGLFTRNLSIGVGTTGRLNNQLTNANARVYVSHLDITADTNATVVVVSTGSGSTCATNATTLGTFVLNAGSFMSLPKIRSDLGSNICIAPTVGSVFGSATYGQIGSTLTGQ